MIVLALAASACSAGAYKEEVKSLAAAGRVLVAAPQAYQTARVEIDLHNYEFGLTQDVVDGEALALGPECQAQAQAIASDYRARDQAGAEPAELTAIFERFSEVPSCSLAPGTTLPSAYAPSETEVELTDLLGDYLSGLEAIVEGQTVTNVNQALTEAKAAGQALAEAAGADASVGAASDLLFVLMAAGLEQRRYLALRDAVTAFDPAWRAAAPDIARSLRSHHLSLVSDRARSAGLVRQAMVASLNTPTRIGAGEARLEAFDRMNPILTARNAELRTALEADPAQTVAAFTKAHAKLLEALNDPDRQVAGVLQAVSDLITSARALGEALKGDDA